MKFEVGITAVLSEKDPAYKTITSLGIEKAIEKFKNQLNSTSGVDRMEIVIKEISDESGKN